MASYIEHMKSVCDQRLTEIFNGATTAILTDLPDHPNVGDSAIALGEFAYFEQSGITLSHAFCDGTLSARAIISGEAVVVHGGGNIGGRYPQYDAHRERLAAQMRVGTPLWQAPQTVDFLTRSDRDNFMATMGARNNFRIGVRDAASAAALSSIAGEVVLSPDAFHSYGAVRADEPTSVAVVLARTDSESSGGTLASQQVDWPADTSMLALTTQIRKHSGKLPGLSAVINPRPSRWRQIAEQRFQRGVGILSAGEVIVTDRLHAMLIALQMGRTVIAVDNATHKLSRYADTWFGDTSPSLRFASDFDDALRMLGNRSCRG